jgi:uncharacterized protein YggE
VSCRDFSKLAPILEGSVEDGITDFRSLTYSLSDEEAAKQKAVAEVMKHALGRATAALESKGQKVGGLRFANIDVKQLTGLQEMNVYAMQRLGATQESAGSSATTDSASAENRRQRHRPVRVSDSIRTAASSE